MDANAKNDSRRFTGKCFSTIQDAKHRFTRCTLCGSRRSIALPSLPRYLIIGDGHLFLSQLRSRCLSAPCSAALLPSNAHSTGQR